MRHPFYGVTKYAVLQEYIMQLTIFQIEAIRGWARHQPLISEVYLFGSRAKGKATEASDTDIALRFTVDNSAVTGVFRLNGERWQNELASLTGLDISLSHLAGKDITPKHEQAVADHGVKLFSRQ
ncbi:nucleotidyltransferase family protein [Agrobacterium tumefaciens]|uniref:nucleotidyltransferase family protein n=2 Tax=Agrobacterium tumefaciens TaxID=358 RepID=UPI0009771052|nr:hypothetical protein BV900_22835 [Agrobacterium tumefaciens]